jgi:predicted exporter
MKPLRLLELGAFLLLSGWGAWLLLTRPLDDRLEVMLPEDPALHQSLKLLEDTRTSGKVLIEIRASAPDFPRERFVAALDRLAGDLRSPLVSQVVTPASAMPAPADVQALSAVAPQLLDAAAYAALEERITDVGVSNALKGVRRMLMNPQSMVMSEWFRQDPLGLRAGALKPLEALGNATGHRATISDGHFFSEDGQAALLILETPVKITDHAGCEALIAFLSERLARLPPGLEPAIVAGHLHTLSNQKILQRDLQWTSTLETLFFATVFLLCFRDPRAILVFVIPPLGILAGIAVAGFPGTPLAAVVLGMAGMLAGIAIDCGIHVYVALSHPGAGLTRQEILRRMRHPLLLSALTNTAPLACLLLSTIPGYRQLGGIASCTLLGALFLALRGLPLCFTGHAAPLPRVSPEPRRHLLPPRAILAIYAAALAGGLFAATRLSVNLDFTKLDGTEPDILERERVFFQRWSKGQGNLGLLAVWSADPEQARRANDLLYARLKQTPAQESPVASLAALWPSEQTRRERVALWRDFWARNADPLRARVNRIAPTLGFAPAAFEPFFQTLAQGTDVAAFPTNSAFLAGLAGPFTRHENGQFMLLSFFPDDPATAAALGAVTGLPARHACVSRRAFQQAFSESVTRDLTRQAILGIMVMGLLIALMVRNWRAVLLVCLPPVSGVTGMLTGLSLAGEPLTPITLLSTLLLIGISIDYGVFMLEAWQWDARATIGRSLTLGWMTAAGGAALLMVARHPVLFATGLAISTGVTCSYASARWVAWPLAQCLKTPRQEAGS